MRAPGNSLMAARVDARVDAQAAAQSAAQSAAQPGARSGAGSGARSGAGRRARVALRLAGALGALACAALGVLPGSAQAQPAVPDSRTTVGVQAERALQARQQAASCAACHGPDGHAPAGSPIPGLAGKPQAQMIEQMLAFKNGQRAGTVMPQLARGYSDAEIVAIAAWFSDPAQTRR